MRSENESEIFDSGCLSYNLTQWTDDFLSEQALFNESELVEQLFLPICGSNALLLHANSNSSANETSESANSSEFGGDESERLQFWAFWLIALPCLTIFGNAVVVISIIKEKMLRSGINYFMLSLAFADIFVGLVLMPLAIYVEVNNGRWQLNFRLCDAYVALDVLFCTASIFNITMICLDRYLAVTHPVSYAKKMGKQRVVLMVVIAWLLSLIIALPIVSGLNESYEAELRESCTLNNPTFIIYSSIGSFFVPCLIMIPLYSKVLLVIYHHSKRRAARRGWVKENIKAYSQHCQRIASNTAFVTSFEALTGNNNSVAATQAIPIDNNNNNNKNNNNTNGSTYQTPTSPLRGASLLSRGEGVTMTTNAAPYKISRMRALVRKETKATITLLLVVGVFLTLWLPFFTVNVLTALCLQSKHFSALCAIPGQLGTLFVWFGYLQSLLNPVIYALSNYEYRKAFRRLFRCSPQPYRNWNASSRTHINHGHTSIGVSVTHRRETTKLWHT